MQISFLDILITFGLVLSLFLVVLILSSNSFRNDVHKYFALALISLNLSLTVTWFEDYVPSNGALELISWPFLFPFAFLMYVLKAIKHPLGASRKIWVLFLPCVVISLFQLIDFVSGFDVFAWITGDDEESYLLLIELLGLASLIFTITLLLISFYMIRKAVNLYDQERKWLQFNTLSILLFFGLWLFSDPIAILFDLPIWEYLLASLAIFLVITTYRGIHALNVFEQRRIIRGLQHEVNDKPTSSGDFTSRQSKKSLQKIAKLQVLMEEEQLYLNPNITRSLIAEKLELSDGYLSELIKNALDTNFNDLVNEYRVKHAISMFNSKQFDIFSIEAIGYESGFKTKSVFYTAFKKVTNQAPGNYRKTMNKS